MTVVQAFTDGFRRVHRAPAVLLGVWLLAIFVSPPLAFPGPVINPLRDEVHRIPVDAAAAYIILGLFLAGGIIDRYARNRPTHAHGFFGATGVFFFRFLRLAIIIGVIYGILFGLVRPWLFERLYPWATRDVLNAAFGALIAGCNLIVDYALIRAVVEDRRSMIGALGAAVGFVRHAPAALSLYALDLTLFLLLAAAYTVVAPEVEGTSRWLALAIGQSYALACLWLRLIAWASETALFQGRLAHAGYVVAPAATWPDSPEAEPFGN